MDSFLDGLFLIIPLQNFLAFKNIKYLIYKLITKIATRILDKIFSLFVIGYFS